MSNQVRRIAADVGSGIPFDQVKRVLTNNLYVERSPNVQLALDQARRTQSTIPFLNGIGQRSGFVATISSLSGLAEHAPQFACPFGGFVAVKDGLSSPLRWEPIKPGEKVTISDAPEDSPRIVVQDNKLASGRLAEALIIFDSPPSNLDPQRRGVIDFETFQRILDVSLGSKSRTPLLHPDVRASIQRASLESSGQSFPPIPDDLGGARPGYILNPLGVKMLSENIGPIQAKFGGLVATQEHESAPKIWRRIPDGATVTLTSALEDTLISVQGSEIEGKRVAALALFTTLTMKWGE